MFTEIVETEIVIDENDNWWNGKLQITNNGVIKFFKLNLNKDPIQNRYFIHLKHNKKEEKGYLKKVIGFPLLAKNFLEEETIKFELDNLVKTSVKEIFYDPIKNSYWSLWYDSKSQSYIPYRVTSKILQILSSYLEYEHEQYFFSYQNLNIPILEKTYEPNEFSNASY